MKNTSFKEYFKEIFDEIIKEQNIPEKDLPKINALKRKEADLKVKEKSEIENSLKKVHADKKEELSSALTLPPDKDKQDKIDKAKEDVKKAEDDLKMAKNNKNAAQAERRGLK